MSEKKLGQEPAFSRQPILTGLRVMDSGSGGMSKRFYAACAAMNGILSSLPTSNEDTIFMLESMESEYGDIKVGRAIAMEAFMYADELLKQEDL